MMLDSYSILNKGISPSRTEVESYSKILDANNDGKITE